MVRASLLTLLTVCVLTAGSGVLTREGDYWVRTETGKLGSFGVLRVRMRGPVTVRGTATSPHFVLKTRVRARNENEARRLLEELHVRNQTLRDAAVFTLVCSERPRAAADLEVYTSSRTPVWIETQSGDVQVYDVAADVSVKTGAGLIQMDRIGGEVAARTEGGEIRLGTIAGGVRCYSGGGSIEATRSGGESSLETAGGNVLLGESAGAVNASTAGGNIHIGRARSSVIARSAGGRIEVQQAAGVVMAGNSGGSIQVGPAQGVRLEATGGSIRLRGSSGALLAFSDVGSILAELIPGVRLQDSALSTGAGDITVYIPSDIPLTIRALNQSERLGRIVSEFPEILVRQALQESRMLAEGALNGGGPLLQLTSTGGTIYLRRVRQVSANK